MAIPEFTHSMPVRHGLSGAKIDAQSTVEETDMVGQVALEKLKDERVFGMANVVLKERLGFTHDQLEQLAVHRIVFSSLVSDITGKAFNFLSPNVRLAYADSMILFKNRGLIDTNILEKAVLVSKDGDVVEDWHSDNKYVPLSVTIRPDWREFTLRETPTERLLELHQRAEEFYRNQLDQLKINGPKPDKPNFLVVRDASAFLIEMTYHKFCQWTLEKNPHIEEKYAPLAEINKDDTAMYAAEFLAQEANEVANSVRHQPVELFKTALFFQIGVNLDPKSGVSWDGDPNLRAAGEYIWESAEPLVMTPRPLSLLMSTNVFQQEQRAGLENIFVQNGFDVIMGEPEDEKPLISLAAQLAKESKVPIRQGAVLYCPEDRESIDPVEMKTKSGVVIRLEKNIYDNAHLAVVEDEKGKVHLYRRSLKKHAKWQKKGVFVIKTKGSVDGEAVVRYIPRSKRDITNRMAIQIGVEELRTDKATVRIGGGISDEQGLIVVSTGSYPFIEVYPGHYDDKPQEPEDIPDTCRIGGLQG